MSAGRSRETGPFASDAAHLGAELARLDVLLAAHLDRRWADREGADPLVGLRVSEAEVARHLAGRGSARANGAHGAEGTEATNGTDATNGRDGRTGPDTPSVAVERATRTLRSRTARTLAAGRELRLARLADRLDLDRRALDALVLALAPAVDRKYGRVYAHINDDPAPSRPTVGLAADLAGGALSDRLAPFAPDAPLVEWGLLRVAGGPDVPLAERPLVVPDRAVEHLLGGDALPEEDQGWLAVERPAGTAGDLAVPERHAAAVERLAERVRRVDRAGRGRHPFVVVDGPYGTGRAGTVAAVAAAADRPLLAVDASEGVPHGRLRTVALEALLREAAVHLRSFDAGADEGGAGDGDGSLRSLLATLDALPGPVFLTTAEPLPAPALAAVTDHATVALSFPRPSVHRRRADWARRSLPEGAEPSALAATFRLPPGAVDDAMATARRLARSVGEPLAAEHVYAGARAQTGARLGRLADRIDPRYDWGDIVLPEDTMAHLREAAANLRHRGTVYEDWGFAERFAAGTGLTALFAGPSGTGKTMAAEVLANDAGLELYRVDLSTVVDKYVGETEKNLGRVFDAAVDADAVLLFDEADALFGSRSAVSDAHDRYANVEVNYLLQRIEAHDGPVVLTTNLKGNVDEAFLRRITVGIDFPRPDREARAAIWRLVFPDETPLGDLDVDYLAGFELTGGNIENVARAAAFLAAEDDAAEGVGMAHVVRAVRRELRKNGRLTTPEDFGDYRDHL
ncbi:MAG: ATP-binding protein [Haloarculaceae archaeon]